MRYRHYYAGIRVRDLNRSLRFYTRLLGMKVVGRGVMGHRGRYVHLQSLGSTQRLELNWYPRGSEFHTAWKAGTELDHLAFVVPDVRRAYADLLRRGARSALSPDKAGSNEVYVKDPDGIWIELLPS